MNDYETAPASSPWHDRLPVGERLSAQPLLDDPMGSFEGDLQLAPLAPMLVPERPRSGELDPDECGHCRPRSDWGGWIWRDELWHVGTPTTFGIPFWAGLAPDEHVQLHEMGPELADVYRRQVAAAMAAGGGEALVREQ